MKSKLAIFIALTLLIVPNFSLAQGANSFEVIMFYGEGCPHCAKTQRAITTYLDNGYNFDFVEYEIYHSQENQQLFSDYADVFGFAANAVPVIIIGQDYFIGADLVKLQELMNYCSTNNCFAPSQLVAEYQAQNNGSNPNPNNSGGNPNTHYIYVGWIVLIAIGIIGLGLLVYKFKKQDGNNLSAEKPTNTQKD